MAELLGGIALAAFVFAALLWSIYRAVVTEGRMRVVAILLSLTTLFGMATLSWLWVVPAQITGAALIVLGLMAIWTDPGWSKLLPFVQAIFGVVLIVGLPWLVA